LERIADIKTTADDGECVSGLADGSQARSGNHDDDHGGYIDASNETGTLLEPAISIVDHTLTSPGAI
jgi:hypothetical protein